MLTIALSHLLGSGVRLETHEAVALARELLGGPGGVPTVENIQLASDGSVSCIDAEGRPSVASVAGLLQMLLPAGTRNVPAPLRYSIARALEAVEAPRFASTDDFSVALARFEKGPSREVLRGLLQRSARPSRPIAARGPTLVAGKPLPPPSDPRPTAATMFRVIGVDKNAAARSNSPRRWALAAASAVIALFVAGFTLGDRIIDWRGATKASSSVRVSSEVSVAALVARDAPANAGEGEPRQDAPNSLSDRAAEPVGAVQAIRAINANAFSPAFASDGRSIFFHTGRERDPRSAIEVAAAGNEAGGRVGVMTVVDDGAHNYHAQPSPDGRFVAFDSDRDGKRGVYVANRDGSQIRRISGAGYAAVPTWSHDSDRLAYIRAEPDQPSVWNLWIQPAVGGGARRVTNYRYGQTWAASWFPDDSRIAYSHEDMLMVMNLQTGETTRYRTPVKGRLVRTPAVSPDGTKIIFQVFRRGAWLLNLADGSMRRVLTDPTAEEFAWSPDGLRVAFHSRRGGQWGIYVLSRS